LLRSRSVTVQHLEYFIFGPHGLPRRAAVEHQAELVALGLDNFYHAIDDVGGQAVLGKRLAQGAGKRREDALFPPKARGAGGGSHVKIAAVQHVTGQRLLEDYHIAERGGQSEEIFVGLDDQSFGYRQDAPG
jgi:hypothetical protein